MNEAHHLAWPSPSAVAARPTSPLQPKTAAAGAYVVENVRVPNETDDAITTKVAVQFPEGFAEASYQAVPGWSVKVVKEKLATPVKTDDGEITEGVKTITWTATSKADGIAPGQFQDFPLSVQIPGKAGDTLTFKALQTYSDGTVARWIGAPDADKPAPQVQVTEAAEDHHAAAAPARRRHGDDREHVGAAAATPRRAAPTTPTPTRWRSSRWSSARSACWPAAPAWRPRADARSSHGPAPRRSTVAARDPAPYPLIRPHHVPADTTPTKRERRDAARAERLEHEQAATAAAARRKRLIQLGALLAAAVVIVVVAIADLLRRLGEQVLRRRRRRRRCKAWRRPRASSAASRRRASRSATRRAGDDRRVRRPAVPVLQASTP